jgi:mannose-6-phosphate isomerase
MNPIVLPPNGVARFYLGGPAIAALRGDAPVGDRVPEDWVASVTEAFGEPGVGLSPLPDGTLLRDAIAADPVAWLGDAHVERHGPDPSLLVKLLDAGERLPVHLHPGGPFAREHLGTRYGKTEAWIVVGGTGEVAVGWREELAAPALRELVDTQDAAAMLGALHRVPVAAGDALFVPAGVAHAIGEGLLIVELQEPTDMSVMLEWEGHGIDGEADATLGLGWDVALECVERAARDPRGLAGPAPDGAVARLLPAAADPFFRALRLRSALGPVRLEPGFAVLVALDGAGSLHPQAGEPVQVERGATVVVPHAAGAVEVSGDLEALACLPPAPDAPTAGAR